MKVPIANFTALYMKNPQYILPPNSPSLDAVTTDGVYVYYGAMLSNRNLVYRMNLSEFALDLPLQITGVGASFAGAFADPERNFVYFFASGSPSALVRVCGLISDQFDVTFAQVDTQYFNQSMVSPLVFEKNARVFVHDSYGGHVYFGHYLNPGIITNINLQSFLVQPVLTLEYISLPLYPHPSIIPRSPPLTSPFFSPAPPSSLAN
jgi:hypothetical protein